MIRYAEGQKISSFIKGSDKIWEGTILKNSQGLVVLNENTGTWRKIDDLEYIKITESTDEKSFIPNINTFSEYVDTEMDKFDTDKIEKSGEKGIDDLSKNFLIKAKANKDIKDTPNKPEDAKKVVGEQVALQKAQDSVPDAAGEMQKAEKELEVYKKEMQESISQLHPLLQKILKENEDDKNISTEEIINSAKDLLEDGIIEVADELKKKFDIDDESAEKYATKAMEEFLIKEKDDQIDDRIDDIEEDFEKTIDEYDGPDDELLDHLVDEYEIDPEEAESIYVDKKGSLTECIMAFVDIVKNRLKLEQ